MKIENKMQNVHIVYLHDIASLRNVIRNKGILNKITSFFKITSNM